MGISVSSWHPDAVLRPRLLIAALVVSALTLGPSAPSLAQEGSTDAPSSDDAPDEAGDPVGPDAGRLGLGGDPGLAADAVIPFRAGVADHLTFEASVQNLSDARVGLTVRSDGPPEVSVTLADTAPPSLAPGEQQRIPLVLRVGATLPVGDHPVRFTIAPAPYSGPVAGVSYAPGIGGRVLVRVTGAEATVRLVARDVLLDEPTESGRLSLYALQPDAEPLLLGEAETSELVRSVVPGMFRAAFERPAVDEAAEPVTTTVDFTLVDGADETVNLDVVGFRVADLEVTPGVDAAGDVVHADVAVTLRNRLEPLRRPMVLELEVRRDGRLVEVLELARVLWLPTGETTTSNRYRPPGGFEPGKWQFDVRLAAGWFGVGPQAPIRLGITGDGPAAAGQLNQRLVVVLAVLLMLAAIGLLVGRRRPRALRDAVRATDSTSSGATFATAD